MAQLKWSDVNAPHFIGAVQGLATAGQLIGNGFNGLSSALGQYGDQEALSRLAQYRDAGLLGSDLNSGLFDTRNASATALGTIMARGQALENQQAQTLANEHNAAMNPLTQQNQQLINDSRVLGNSYDMANNPMRLADTAMNLSQKAVSQARTEANYQRNIKLNTGFQNLIRSGMQDATSMDNWVNSFTDPLDKQAAMQIVQQYAPSIGKPVMAPDGIITSTGTVIPGGSSAPTGTPGAIYSAAVQANPNLPTFFAGLAQLETQGGKKTIKGGGQDTNNLYNIKDFSKAGTGIRGQDTTEGSNDRYRQFSTLAEGDEALTDLLGRKYPGALTAKTPQEFAAALKAGGYATDPEHAAKLTNIINGIVAKGGVAIPASVIAEQAKAAANASGNNADMSKNTAGQLAQAAVNTANAASMVSVPSSANRVYAAYSADPNGLKDTATVASAMHKGDFPDIPLDKLSTSIKQIVTSTGLTPAAAGEFLRDHIGEASIGDGLYDYGKGLFTGARQIKDDELKDALKASGFNLKDPAQKANFIANASNALATNQRAASVVTDTTDTLAKRNKISADITATEALADSPAKAQRLAVLNAQLAQLNVSTATAANAVGQYANQIGGVTPPAPPPPPATNAKNTQATAPVVAPPAPIVNNSAPSLGSILTGTTPQVPIPVTPGNPWASRAEAINRTKAERAAAEEAAKNAQAESERIATQAKQAAAQAKQAADNAKRLQQEAAERARIAANTPVKQVDKSKLAFIPVGFNGR